MEDGGMFFGREFLEMPASLGRRMCRQYVGKKLRRFLKVGLIAACQEEHRLPIRSRMKLLSCAIDQFSVIPPEARINRDAGAEQFRFQQEGLDNKQPGKRFADNRGFAGGVR